jgi:nucleotide-binding universal stress UspA family protein
MKKIIVAINGSKVDLNTLDFACYLGRLTKSRITGVVLENFVAEYRPMVKKDYDSTYVDWEVDEKSPRHLEKMELIEKNIRLISDACTKREVNSDIYRAEGVPATEIIMESRFADLLVISAETSFNKRYEGSPTSFVKAVLREAECPVIITPESFESIDEIIFCYDGSRSAVFSIKQFNYLLPELKNKQATLLEVNRSSEASAADKERLKKWIVQHNPNIRFETLQGEAKDELFSYLLPKKNAFIVMGAFGRGLVSTLFKKSTAERIIKTTSLPVFISHH